MKMINEINTYPSEMVSKVLGLPILCKKYNTGKYTESEIQNEIINKENATKELDDTIDYFYDFIVKLNPELASISHHGNLQFSIVFGAISRFSTEDIEWYTDDLKGRGMINAKNDYRTYCINTESKLNKLTGLHMEWVPSPDNLRRINKKLDELSKKMINEIRLQIRKINTHPSEMVSKVLGLPILCKKYNTGKYTESEIKNEITNEIANKEELDNTVGYFYDLIVKLNPELASINHHGNEQFNIVYGAISRFSTEDIEWYTDDLKGDGLVNVSNDYRTYRINTDSKLNKLTGLYIGWVPSPDNLKRINKSLDELSKIKTKGLKEIRFQIRKIIEEAIADGNMDFSDISKQMDDDSKNIDDVVKTQKAQDEKDKLKYNLDLQLMGKLPSTDIKKQTLSKELPERKKKLDDKQKQIGDLEKTKKGLDLAKKKIADQQKQVLQTKTGKESATAAPALHGLPNAI